MERVKLFNDSTPKRYKLFSGVEKQKSTENRVKLFCGETEVEVNAAPEMEAPRIVRCIDCGYEMETLEDSAALYCPNCGGTRFETVEQDKVFSDKDQNRIKLFTSDEEQEAEFQKVFSETDDELELKLKEFSGKSLTHGEFQREFGKYISEDELCERGFSEISDDKINISSDAFLMSRLFSSIKISVTKSLEFDPSIVNCENKKEVIERIGENSNFPPHVITLLKEAHGIPMKEENDAWIEDSGICKDLKLEFGGEQKTLPELKAIINERYPDAPENILALLKEKGVIEVEGDQVKFI